MPRELAAPLRPSLVRRLARLLLSRPGDKQTLSFCTNRMAALDDPQTRRALAGLPPHLLRDIGVHDACSDNAPIEPPEGEALRRHLW